MVSAGRNSRRTTFPKNKSQLAVGKDEARQTDGHIASSESRLKNQTENANEPFEEAKEIIPQPKDKNLGLMTEHFKETKEMIPQDWFASGLGTFQYRLEFVLSLGLGLGLVSGFWSMFGFGLVLVLELGRHRGLLSIRLCLTLHVICLAAGSWYVSKSEFEIPAVSESVTKKLPSILAEAFRLGLVLAAASLLGLLLKLELRLGLKLRLVFGLGLGLGLFVGSAVGLWMHVCLVLVKNLMFCYGWLLGILLVFGYAFLIKEKKKTLFLGDKSQFGVGTEPKDEASEIDGHVTLSESGLKNQTQNANGHFEEAKEMIPQRKDKNLGIMTRNQPVKCSSIEDTDIIDEKINPNDVEVSSPADDVQLPAKTSDNDDTIASVEQHSYQADGRNEEAKSDEKELEIALTADKSVEKQLQKALKVVKNKEEKLQKAYLELGNAYTRISDYNNAIEYCQKARGISPCYKADGMEAEANQWLGDNHYRAGQYQESVAYYKQALELASQCGDIKRKIKAHFGLGNAFSHTGDLESSREYFLKAVTATQQINDRSLRKEAHANLGYVYYKSSMFEAAIKSYREVQNIAHDLGQEKDEMNAFLKLGDIFQELKKYKKAIKSYQDTLNISKNLEDEEMQLVVIRRLGLLYLTLASDHSENHDYDKSIEWYQKALEISEAKPTDQVLRDKALTGLGLTWLNLGDNAKAIESIHAAQEASIKEKDADSHKTTNEQTNEQKASCSPVSDSGVKQVFTTTLHEAEPVTVWASVDALIEEVYNPSSLERISSEDFAHVEKYIEISPSYVYTREISPKKPLTPEARKAMTENVKQAAYERFLDHNDKESEGNVRKFANGDDKIYNFARSEVVKNASTQKPARLNKVLTSYMRSIGQIVCGSIRATCFLVTNDLVITNYHVYRMIAQEREKLENPNLPINVLFDYLYHEKIKPVVTVEVDESMGSFENPYLDYKLFRLKQSDGLADRVPLGPMVRNWQLSDGRVIVLGHPEGNEMHDEVCVVVGYRAMQETLRKRHEQFNGVHMTNSELLDKTENYQGSLSYDTTFFAGASGSPIFDINGYIVAMHAQGYTLERTQDNDPNQPENVPNPEHEDVPNQYEDVPNLHHENVPNQYEGVSDPGQGSVPNPYEDVPNQYEDVPNPVQENVSNQENLPNPQQENVLSLELQNLPEQRNPKKYSLMEFGVQFICICRDIKHWHGEHAVLEIFPNYKFKPMDETKQPMDLNML